MAEEWEDTDEPAEVADVEIETEADSYYKILYKQRALWTKHYCPVRFWSDKSGLFVEAYIRTIVAPRTEESIVDLERLYKEPDSSGIAVLPHGYIYPTYRILKHQDDSGNIVTMEPAVLPDDFKVDMAVLPLTEIKTVYVTYKGQAWTALELCSMLNLAREQAEFISRLPFLKQVGKRKCLITAQESDTFTIVEEDPVTVNSDSVFNKIPDIQHHYSNCTRCDLGVQRAGRNCSIAFGRGNIHDPSIFIIGEAPGMQEERDEIPFNPQAPAGGILDKVMTAAGISQDNDCYITNAVLCRPESDQQGSQNGKPQADHIAACNTRLKNELAILKPKVILLLGATAFQAYYGKSPAGSLASHLGWIEETPKFSVYLAYHPSYIARQMSMLTRPEEKTKLKTDYLKVFQDIKSKL